MNSELFPDCPTVWVAGTCRVPLFAQQGWLGKQCCWGGSWAVWRAAEGIPCGEVVLHLGCVLRLCTASR